MTTPTVPVPVSYRDAHTISLALEARARWMDEGSGTEGPRRAHAAYYRDLADRYNRAALELLRTYPTEQVRAEMRADERSTTV